MPETEERAGYSTSRRHFDFEEWQHKTEKVKLPARWEKIVTHERSPEYDEGHPFYNDGFLVEEGNVIDVLRVAEVFSQELGEVLARPDWDRLRVALLRSRVFFSLPENRYLRLNLHKGKVSFQTRRFIPISQRHSYCLSGMLRTGDLSGIHRPVKAWISVLWFKDARPDAICLHADGSPAIFRTTEIDKDTAGEWRRVKLLFSRVPHDAKYAKIRVSVEGESVEATADFDDIVLVQEPQIIVGFDRTSGLFFPDEEVVLRKEIAGLPAGDYEERLTIESISGGASEIIPDIVGCFKVSGGPEQVSKSSVLLKNITAKGVFRLTYRLFFADGTSGPMLPVGARQVAERTVTFARAVRPIPLNERGRYGVTFDFFATPYAAAADFVRLVGASPLKTSLWGEREENKEQLDLFERMLARMRRSSINVAGIIRPLSGPRAADEGLGSTGSAYAFFTQPDKRAEEALYDFMKNKTGRWADLLRYLQPGDDGDSSIADNDFFAGVKQGLRSHLVSPLSGVRMIVPITPGKGAAPPSGEEILAFCVPESTDASALSEILEGLARDTDRLWVTLEPKRVSGPGEIPAQVADLIKKIVVCRKYGVKSVLLPLLGDGSALMSLREYPDEMLEVHAIAPALLNVASLLERSTFHEVFSRDGVTVNLFKKGKHFVAMLHSPEAGKSFRVFWGNDIVQYDVLGNSRRLRPEKGMTVIEDIGPVPLFIDNIDVGVAQTWQSIRLATPQVTSKTSPQTISLRLKNNFDKPLTGLVRLEFPPELEHLVTKHRPVPFELQPGEEWESGGQFQLSPSISDGLGVKEFEAVAELIVGGESHQLRKKLTVQQVPDLLSLEVTSISVDERGEVVLGLKVTNKDTKRISANLYLKVGRDACDRQLSIAGLEAGKEHRAEIHLPFRPESLPGAIWVGLRQIRGKQFVNIYVTKEEVTRRTSK
ncbi:MAG: hypothetical protein ABIH04_10205 [Planctomycetota bacterium]